MEILLKFWHLYLYFSSSLKNVRCTVQSWNIYQKAEKISILNIYINIVLNKKYKI